MDTKVAYQKIGANQLPAAVRFDVPAPNQGQIIEVAYGGFDRTEHGEGAAYKRVIDYSVGPTPTYYRRTTNSEGR